MTNEHDDRKEGMAIPTGRLAVAETMRSVAETSAKADSKPKDEEKLSLFWRVFGGTVLSISALVVMTLYNNLATGITNLQADLAKERDARADMVKKDDFNTRSSSIFDRLRTHDAMKADIEGLRERVTGNATALESVKKDTAAAVEDMKKETTTTVTNVRKGIETLADQVKKDEAISDILKERLTAVESLKKDVAAIDTLKEKLNSVTSDLKSLRDDVVKATQEVERNRSAELERKAGVDIQLKQIDDAVKDLQKGLIDCREKLARLEGALPAKPAKQ